MEKDVLVRVPFARFRNETLVEFFNDELAVIKRLGAGAIGIKAVSDDLIVAAGDVVAVLDPLKGSFFTPDIVEQDLLRNGVVRTVSTKANSKLHDPAADKRLAARNVLLVLKNYGNIPRRTYDDGTAAIDDLLRELNKTEMLPNVTALKLADDIADLTAANTRFAELMQARYQEAGTRPLVPMKEARARAEELQYKLIKRVEAIVTLNGIDFSPELTSFVQEYNAIAKRYKNILASEKGRRKASTGGNANNDDETTPEDTPDAPDPDVDAPEETPETPPVAPTS